MIFCISKDLYFLSKSWDIFCHIWPKTLISVYFSEYDWNWPDSIIRIWLHHVHESLEYIITLTDPCPCTDILPPCTVILYVTSNIPTYRDPHSCTMISNTSSDPSPRKPATMHPHTTPIHLHPQKSSQHMAEFCVKFKWFVFHRTRPPSLIKFHLVEK